MAGSGGMAELSSGMAGDRMDGGGRQCVWGGGVVLVQSPSGSGETVKKRLVSLLLAQRAGNGESRREELFRLCRQAPLW